MISGIFGFTTMTYVVSIILAFIATVEFTRLFMDKLPRDQGRDFAHDGKLSAGKPRGAGIIFVLCFLGVALLFGRLSVEIILYFAVIFFCMLNGYLDDASKTPWGELVKGILDLCVAVAVAVIFLIFNKPVLTLSVFKVTFTLPVVVYGILIVVLVWAAINVTNCADGVDALSGTVGIITLLSIYILSKVLGNMDFAEYIPLFVSVLTAYLWFNATPSILMMGDGGSRTLGIFIAIAALKSGDPTMFIPLAIVLILDGGLGLFKVTVIRITKCKTFMNKIRTPLHDHARKLVNWSNAQTVYRFAIIQIVVSFIFLGLVVGL